MIYSQQQLNMVNGWLRGRKGLRACFENIPDGLAAGPGGWLRCSSVEDPRGIFSFVTPRHPPRRARNPLPDLFSKQALPDCEVVASLGFAPRPSGSKPGMLLLHHGAMSWWSRR